MSKVIKLIQTNDKAGVATLNKAIKSISTRGVKFDHDVHEACVSAMVHSAKYGDLTIMSSLVAALPNGYRSNMVIDFVKFFGPFDYDTTKDVFTHTLSKKDAGNKTVASTRELAINLNGDTTAKEKTARHRGCMNCSPSEFKPEPKYDGFDFDKAMLKFLESVETKVGWKTSTNKDTRAKSELNHIDGAKLASVRALFPKPAEAQKAPIAA